MAGSQLGFPKDEGDLDVSIVLDSFQVGHSSNCFVGGVAKGVELPSTDCIEWDCCVAMRDSQSC